MPPHFPPCSLTDFSLFFYFFVSSPRFWALKKRNKMGTLKLRLDPNNRVSKKGKTTIYLEYSHRHDRKLFSTKESIESNLWNSESENIEYKGKNIEYNRINAKISDLKNKVSWILLTAEKEFIEPTCDFLVFKLNQTKTEKTIEFNKEKEKLELLNPNDSVSKKIFISKLNESEEFEKYDSKDPEDIIDFKKPMTLFYLQLRKYRKFQMKKRALATYKKNKTVFRFLKEFDKKGNLNFESLGFDFFNKFEMWLADKGQSDNTVWGHLKILKAFINFAFAQGWHNNLDHKKFRLTWHDPVIVSPTQEEIIALYNHRFKSPLYEKIKKLYLCNCFIGARFEDFIRFDATNFSEKGIYYFQTKNEDAEQVYVPYYSISREILEEFNYKIPRISNQKFNNYLHKLLKECELFNRVVEVKEFYHGKMIKKNIALHQALSSHSCRKFFCSLHANSTDINIVQAMALSGHKMEKNFKRYVVIQKQPLESGVNNIDKQFKKI